MNKLVTMFILVIVITMVLMIMVSMVSKKMLTENQKSTPFECGFNPMSYSRIPFSIHFFMIAVIFLIFDIEIIMIMPMIMTIKVTMLKTWILTSVTFTIILLMGLYHEWKNGMINWTD